jgi:hypothetical protein
MVTTRNPSLSVIVAVGRQPQGSTTTRSGASVDSATLQPPGEHSVTFALVTALQKLRNKP